MSETTRWRLVVQERVGLRRSWLLVWYRDERRLFDSRWVALDLVTERGARWLAQVVRRAIEAGVYAPPSRAGNAWTHRAPIAWRPLGGPGDDCACDRGAYIAHVEHVAGSSERGGGYHLDVTCNPPSPSGFTRLHSRELGSDIAIRSSGAARFLAELVIDLGEAGQPVPHIAGLLEA